MRISPAPSLRNGYKAHVVGEPEPVIHTRWAVTKAGEPGSCDTEAGFEILGTASLGNPPLENATKS